MDLQMFLCYCISHPYFHADLLNALSSIFLVVGAALAAYSTYTVAASIRTRIGALFSRPVPTLTLNPLHVPKFREPRLAHPIDRKEADEGRSA